MATIFRKSFASKNFEPDLNVMFRGSSSHSKIVPQFLNQLLLLFIERNSRLGQGTQFVLLIFSMKVLKERSIS